MQQAVKGEQCFALYFDNNTQEIYYSSNQNKQLTANFQLFADFKAKNLTGTAQAQIWQLVKLLEKKLGSLRASET